ncbi:DUF120 domain-containing protein [Natrarchaeobius halalkaliphilus]|uniref:DUF120 domain-containing protein n=1 Tax=Natrarchaeobius halalkaliphilus TaxID=1679091 RepID=A0A3N6NVQ6_9EURY|nr:DUF120 domain-containing protein [Natrarchaeobius halalkaliphilus]RQG87952.1 DUF120 domain-containing protein [Natrarchaeobius halalkaliphilus]
MNGRVTSGEGQARGFIEAASELLTDALGFRPYPGTLNLENAGRLESLSAERHPIPGDDHCEGIVTRSCRIGGLRGAVVEPIVPNYPDEKTELVAPVRIRSVFDLADGSEVDLTAADRCDGAWNPTIDGRSIDAFDGVVFDLDKTLLTLDVDWPAVHRDVEALLESVLEKPLPTYTRLEVFELAAKAGRSDELESLLADRERAGARTANSRPLLDVVADLDCPVGICTANAERAAEIALERFGALGDVDAIVGRDTLAQDKPHPRTLLEVVRTLNVAPGNVLYVGDEETDAELAVAAETSYAHPDQFRGDGV